ncbi:MAG TPA: heparan-alpha-glucosaminide N-acetyltransferase domain-containing protein, partial [Myxococcota bacterium]|nr:heparan-alpha-glucosaminide N-acetyltransferase domain-containing protein [Myxococcota bacterium]
MNDLSAETSLGFGDVEAVPNPRPERNQAIDWLRGAVMILMALDHSRMFLGPAVDLRTAAPALYFTRWITHFCAPVFVLLAGTAAYLHGQRLGSTRALSRYLLTRGLWLAFLEVTVVRFVWILYFGPQILVLQVIWAIGVSMIVLAGLVWLPDYAIAAFALALIAGHNVFDSVH